MKPTILTSRVTDYFLSILCYYVFAAFAEDIHDQSVKRNDELDVTNSNEITNNSSGAYFSFKERNHVGCWLNNSSSTVSSKTLAVSSRYYLILLYIVVCGILICLAASFIECYRTLKREGMGLSTEEQREVDRIREQRIMVVAKKNRREILESILHCQTVEEVKKNAATLAVSEGAEKIESTITERSSSDKSFDYHEASGDSDSVQDLELGAHSHKRHAMISLLPSQKKPAMDPRGVYSSLAARDELKPDVAHQLVDEEYLKRSIACTESSSECAICLCTYDDDDIVMFSKYCTHCFHKECIFEWLQNNDVCPCCRCPLVTSSEVNTVASDILGKTPIINAMKLYST